MPLPALLRALLAAGRWRQPPDEILYSVVPFLREPVDLLLSEEAMRRESSGQCVDVPQFREYRGSLCEPKPLPWLDDDLALLIAVNRERGDDIAIALDYRTSYEDPRVVGSDWWSDNNKSVHWREIAPTFTAFVSALRL